MAEMTPRERSELVRRQSRAYIVALRENRLQRATQTVQPPAPVRSAIKPPSAFYPSTQATARAFEAKAKSSAAPVVSAGSPLEEAAVVRRESAATITEMRETRRSRTKAAPSSAATVPAPKTVASADLAPASAMANDTPDAPAPVRRARAKKTASTGASPESRSEALPPQDIDVISGLGPALKSRLRQAGIATVDTLSAQKPERLREVLGPAGRLVNIEALVRAAATACAGTAPDATPGAKARTAPKSMPSRRAAS